MSNAATPDGRGHDRPNQAEPFFPSEGTFNPVVPFAEIGSAPGPLAPVDPADVGRPAEAAWAREADRAARREEEEATLVPARGGGARRARPSWVATATVVVLSVAAGLVSGTYLIRSSQRASATPPAAEVAAEAPSLPPAPVSAETPAPAAEQLEAVAKPEKAEKAAGEKAEKTEKAERVERVEKPVEAAHTSKQSPPLQTAARAERAAAAAPREVAPAPRPTRTQSAAPSRTRPAAVVQRTPRAAPPGRTLPISSPPPTAKSKKVIQWP